MSLVSSRHTSEPPSGEAASDNKVGEAASDNKVGEPASDKSARIIADMGKHAGPVSGTPVSQNADKSRAGPCLRIPAAVASLGTYWLPSETPHSLLGYTGRNSARTSCLRPGTCVPESPGLCPEIRCHLGLEERAPLVLRERV